MKTLLLLLALLFMPVHALAMEKFVDVLQDNKGNIITGVSVKVYNHGTTTLSTIYSDNGVTLKANPFINATDGTVSFYGANGRYDIVYTKTGTTFVAANTTDRVLFDSVDFGGGGGSGMAIGSAVTSGTPSSLLYVGTGPILSQASLTGLIVGNGVSAPTAYAGATCTNQVIRVLTAAGGATCVSITSAYVDSSILTTAATVTFAQGGTGLSTAADDTVMVSSGSAWVAKSIADCQDTAGNHLNYTASTNAFSCGNSGGSQVYAFSTKTTNYTVLITDKVILCDATSGAVTLTLPAATTTGLFFVIKKIDSSTNACTVTRAGSDTIDGGTTASMTIRYNSINLVADGVSAWSLF